MRATRPITAAVSLAALGLVVALPAAAQTQFVTVGTSTFPGTADNTFPFGVASVPQYAAGGEYQEVYTSAAFTTPSSIASIAFASSSRDAPTIATYDVTLGLSTTGAGTSFADRPSTDFAANKGADFTTVFSGKLTASLLENNTFDLVFPTSPFTYDPSKGNLLLDVIINSPTSGAGGAAFLSNDHTPFGPNASASVYQSFGQGTATTDSSGLYTRFGVTPQVTVVPEPSSAAFLALGFVGLIVVGRKRMGRRARANEA